MVDEQADYLLALNANHGFLYQPVRDHLDRALEGYVGAVSSIRQPVESFFNWLVEHTDIQRAAKVRSTKGLIVHVFGRIAAAFILKTQRGFSSCFAQGVYA